MIINLRGPSGSGKSYIGHKFIDTFGNDVEELYEDGWNKTKPKLVGYRLPGDLYIAGPYRAAGGGADLLAPHDRSRTVDLVERLSERGHVFIEALFASSTIKPYMELAGRVGTDLVFAFLDTPYELCHDRVLMRNGGRPINEDAHRGHHRFVARSAQRFIDGGFHVEYIDHTRAFEQVWELLLSGGWAPHFYDRFFSPMPGEDGRVVVTGI